MKTSEMKEGGTYAYSTKRNPRYADQVTIVDPTTQYGIQFSDEAKVKRDGEEYLLETGDPGEAAYSCHPYNRILVRDRRGNLRGVLPQYIVCTWPEWGDRLVKQEAEERRREKLEDERRKVRSTRLATLETALTKAGFKKHDDFRDDWRGHSSGGSMSLTFDALEKLLGIMTDDDGNLIGEPS